MSMDPLASARRLSPRRKTSSAASIDELTHEQLHHFGIDPASAMGEKLEAVTANLYRSGHSIDELLSTTFSLLDTLSHNDRISYFNAKKFLCFQLAKLIDTLQPSMKGDYQALAFSDKSRSVKGEHPLFCNVSALFSATPAVVRTATYLYACTEWVDDAFHGRESTHPIYTRLLNPTSMALANSMVDLEAGPLAGEYLAWNFNSGMAAIDALLSNQLRHGDILIVSRNVYGGTHQLLHDYFARTDRLAIELVWFDGYTHDDFQRVLEDTRTRYADALSNGKNLSIYLESPCNPHGYVLDVPAICQLAHQHNHTVMLDATLATPFLQKPLQHNDANKRPDFLIHSYTKDISGSGSTTAGVVIGRNHRMFIPKGDTAEGLNWDQSLFWDVYYIKGSFLDADKAIDVYNGMKTLESRMLGKCINTRVFAEFLASHPAIQVNSNAIASNPNRALCEEQQYLGLPSPLFSIDFEQANIPKEAFTRFFDALEPAFSHMVSLGQSNTLLLCPALTSHSELSEQALDDAGITPTTIRIAMGNENPLDLIIHFRAAAECHIDPVLPGFSSQFIGQDAVNLLLKSIYLETHTEHIESSL